MRSARLKNEDTLAKEISELSTDDEKVKCYQALRNNAEEASQPVIEQASHNYQFYAGEHYIHQQEDGAWVTSQPRKGTEHMVRIQGNDLFEATNALLPLFIKNEPGVEISPDSAESFVNLSAMTEDGGLDKKESSVTQGQAAEALTEILNTIMKRNGEVVVHSNILLESFLTGASYVTFQAKRSRTRGTQIEPKLLHRKDFLPDPSYTDSQDFSDCRYMILREYLTPGDIKREFGIDESEYVDGDGVSSVDSSSMGFVARWWDNVTNKGRKSTLERYGLKDYPVDVLYYSHDVPMAAFTDTDIPKDIPPPMQYTFLNGNFLADERVNPLIHQDFPVTAFVASPVPHKPDGVSNISQLVGTQIAINMLTNSILESARAMGSPSLLVEEGAEPVDGWNFGPGGTTVLPRDALDKIRERAGGGVDQASERVLEYLKQSIRNTIGDSGGILGGANPSNIKSGKHANVVMNSLLTRHSHTVAMFDSSWERFSRQRVQLMQQFVDFNTPYWRDQFDAAEFQELSGDVRGQMGEAIRNLLFDVKLHTKSDLPFSPQERINWVTQLWSVGFVDLPYVFKVLDLDVGAEFLELVHRQSNENEFIVGIPGYEQAAMRMQTNQAAAEMNILSGGGSQRQPEVDLSEGGGGVDEIEGEDLSRL